MNALLDLTGGLPLPGGSAFVCGSFGDCVMTLLQVALAVWIVFATLGAVVDFTTRRNRP